MPQELAVTETSSTPADLQRRARYHQRLTAELWRRWRNAYLLLLRSAHSCPQATSPQLKVGDVVIVHDDNAPPMQWRLGRVTMLHPGVDGVARACTMPSRNPRCQSVNPPRKTLPSGPFVRRMSKSNRRSLISNLQTRASMRSWCSHSSNNRDNRNQRRHNCNSKTSSRRNPLPRDGYLNKIPGLTNMIWNRRPNSEHSRLPRTGRS
ncbi:hypothetical protein HPB48_016326 [Haemaphysalis longicornis]|uniref:DUF5641 domain-containing protein n=1 Tax=Haemaphysalis longicornis TaxID=44386 RepID=A0A9J6G2G0_HAELO|nr:hypothetical protein HPB48_016326 [Haemaphysalis longicornis]